MKKTKKPPPRCRHRWGAMEHPSDDLPQQVCAKCGATRFKGDRYAYGSRWKR